MTLRDRGIGVTFWWPTHPMLDVLRHLVRHLACRPTIRNAG
ncbi:hypothetical protein FM104_02805 [Microbacterium esteraromaticum]|uniref:Uncharacterized protein n=1 Tax=Microbacterium esteraromaticum TaxID=57043 RepID=A0A1R4IM79_9MICO|nr:hypothetical protein FM104_02805 [Microbacterium esteraromaticum]